MDEDTCMVDIAKFFLEFTVDESCGKCTPCRIGTRRMLEILEKITKGQATMEDLDKLEELCYHLQSNSLCALGQTAPNPVLSTLRYFRDEYIAHIVDKKCPAGVCKDLLQYKIDPDKCKGCTLCARTCPADAIIGKVKEVHMINPEKCLKVRSLYGKNAASEQFTKNKEGREDGNVNLKINGLNVTAPAGSTILKRHRLRELRYRLCVI